MPAHEAAFCFPYDDPAVATAIERAIRLDAGAIEGDRSAASVRVTDRDDGHPGATVEVTIEAADATALRAAKRTWFSLVRAAEETALAAR